MKRLTESDLRGIAGALAYVAENHPNADPDACRTLAGRVSPVCLAYYDSILGGNA